MIPRLALALSLVALLAAGCLPAALEDATPDAAVIGVPAEALVPGAADGLDARLRRLETGHDFVAAASLRFLEVRSNLVGSRAVPGAARVARSTGAELAVTIEASTLERELDAWGSSSYETAVLQLDVALIRAEDAAVLTRITGPRTTGEALLDGDELPPLADDALIAELTEVGLDALVGPVARELRWLALNGSSVE